jgi:hypothetical protein
LAKGADNYQRHALRNPFEYQLLFKETSKTNNSCNAILIFLVNMAVLAQYIVINDSTHRDRIQVGNIFATK